jgi:thiol-disulfide isomerase/thioredoxin
MLDIHVVCRANDVIVNIYDSERHGYNLPCLPEKSILSLLSHLMNIAACLILLSAVFCCIGSASAQEPAKPGPDIVLDSASARRWKTLPGGENPALTFYKSKTGKPVGLSGVYHSADGKTIDFSNMKRPAFVYYGFYGCHPCMHELPVFMECAANFPDVDFVYITYDKAAVRQKELAELGKKNFKPGSNYYVIEMHDEDIYRSRMTWGYPTKYFVDDKGIVRFVQCGGNPSEPPSDIKKRFADIIRAGRVAN